MLWVYFSLGNLSLFWGFWIGHPNEKKKFVVQPVSVEKSVEGVIMDSKG